MKTTTQTPSAERLAHDVAELRKLGADAVIESGGIIIKGDLICDEEQIADTSIYEYITIISGDAFFSSLTSVGDNFMPLLAGIGKDASFSSLESAGDSFMPALVGIGRDTWFDKMSIEWREKYGLKFKKLEKKYYKEHGFCFFDGIFSIVHSTRSVGDYTIYSCMFGSYIAQNGKFTAHGETVKKAIKDLEYKILQDKVQNSPLTYNDELDAMKYRAITGACFMGMQDFLTAKKIGFSVVKSHKGEITEIITKSIKVSELLPILGDSYGADKIKSLIKLN
jgi:hypothetical protein